MAIATRITGKTNPATPPPTPAAGARKSQFTDRVSAWFRAHKQLTSWIGAIVVVGAVLFAWTMLTARRSEEAASRELQGARFAYDNQNLPLAANELPKVIANFDGTNAAEEARLLLANVRLQLNQPQQAVAVLKDYAGSAAKGYRAQAYGLLGAAYENMGRFREAGEAYENGSAAARLDFLKAQMLTDAGRAWTTAGDTAKAIAAYRRVVKEFEKEGAANEARVRLAELTKGTAS
jgi:tetratricopeptide (TPR) repeat protein